MHVVGAPGHGMARLRAGGVDARWAVAVKTTRSAGMLLLALWLILTGVQGLVSLPIPGVIRTVMALLAGVLILFGI